MSKDSALTYIRQAEEAIGREEYDKAKRLLQQSLQIQKTTRAAQLLAQLALKNNSIEDNKLVNDTIAKTDYYDILGVSKTAAQEDIKRQYKKLALKLHPDKNRAKQAAEAFKKLAQAFACLSNKDKREAYDKQSNVNYEDSINPNDIFDGYFYGRNYWDDYNNENAQEYYEDYETQYSTYQEQPSQRYCSSCFCQVTVLFVAIGLAVILKCEGYFNWTKENDYSFTKTLNNKYYRITQKARVEYYVSKNFDDKYSLASLLQRKEDEIELAYLEILWTQCSEVKDKKAKLEKARFYAHEAQKKELEEKLLKLDMSACENYPRIKRRLVEYNL